MTAAVPVRTTGRAAAPLPTMLEPQLCSIGREAPAGAGWIHEIKYDGWRLLCRKNGSDVRLFTRGGAEWSKRLPIITRALAGLPVSDAWLDGELVYFDAGGFPDFHALQTAVRAGDERQLYFLIWDTPWLAGRDLSRESLVERKARLQRALRGASRRIRYADHVEGYGVEFFAEANRLDLEGIVSKRAGSAYKAGRRCADWRKVKCWRTSTVVIGGMQWTSDGSLEALLVGSPAANGLQYQGRVEMGLGRMQEWGFALDRLIAKRCPFDQPWKDTRRTWLRPEAAIQIRALPQPPGQLLRHAMFMQPAELAAGI